MKHYLRFFCAVLAFCLLAPQVPAPITAKADSDRRIMVSLGDSYSSGEGVEKFYGQELNNKKRSTNLDFLAHRSKDSWPGRLKLNGVSGRMKDHKYNGTNTDTANWFFVAASGAKTKHFNDKQKDKDYKRDGVTADKPLPAQLDVFDQFEKNEVDYVTMTIGGNDVGFTDIITNGVVNILLGQPYLQPASIAVHLNYAWHGFYKKGGAKDQIRQAYIDVKNAAGGKTNIIVAGYPNLFASVPRPNAFFRISEVLFINNSVSKFNNEIKSIVNDLHDNHNMNITFVSVEDAFKGHEAYSTNGSYINELMLNQKYDLKEFDKSDLKTYVSAYSMHPNGNPDDPEAMCGTKAYADCVQKIINKIEGSSKTEPKPEPVPEPEPEPENELDSDFAKKLCSEDWAEYAGSYMSNATHYSITQYSFTEDGTASQYIDSYHSKEEENYTTEYSVVDSNCIEFTIDPKYGDSEETVRVYQMDSNDLLRVEISSKSNKRGGLLIRKSAEESAFDNSFSYNQLNGTSWDTTVLYEQLSYSLVTFYDDSSEERDFLHAEIMFGTGPGDDGITDYIVIDRTDSVAEMIYEEGFDDSDIRFFVEDTGNDDTLNAYIFIDGEYYSEQWQKYYN